MAVVVVSTLQNKCVYAYSGENCTDHNYAPFQSHTLRAQLATTNDLHWKQEMYSKYDLTSAEYNVQNLRSDLQKIDGSPIVRPTKVATSKSPSMLKEVSLHDVRLDPKSLHGQKQQATLDYLLMLNVDSLAYTFRINSGLPNPGTPYGGWEAPDVELRGHFIGHYLSASAKMWASTNDERLGQKMTALVSALKECQDKMGTGYLSAFPTLHFDKVENLSHVWAPYYVVHKIMAGLLDQYTYAKNEQALKMLTWMVDYFYNRVKTNIAKNGIQKHYKMLNEEFGGMNDLLYQLYRITNDPKHLELGHLFDKPCFLGHLAIKVDDLAGLHSNTHIPIVVGAQMRYELLGDEVFKEIGTYFMDIVNSSHSYATGGTSVREHWAEAMQLGSTLTTETEESCTTYNMLKVSRNMFRWTKDVKYADHYERALINGVLGIIRGTEPGIMIYMLPLGHGVSKGKSLHGWGTPFDSFWCCYGTGIESFSKLGDSIYFEEVGKVPQLYLIQYISSTINWQSAGLLVNQTVSDVVSWSQNLQVTVTIYPNKGAKRSGLNLRIPSWSYSHGAKATLNRRSVSLPAPGSFLSIRRKWSPGDKITLNLPFGLRTETIQDDRPEFASLKAILYGPYLLAGLSDGDFNIKTGLNKTLSDWITPVPPTYNDQLISLTQEVPNSAQVYLSTKNKSLVMESTKEANKSSFVHSTFGLIPTDQANNASIVSGRLVMLEPIDMPGVVIGHQEKEGGLVFVSLEPKNASNGTNYAFMLVQGLNGNNGTISLESAAQPGCFIRNLNQNVTLACKDSTSDSQFKNDASFSMTKGLKRYNPISFVAKGIDRSYILEPIFSFRNEYYNVYFNITS